MRKMNDSAQWQLIEVILVAGMLFAAMYLVRSSNITVYKSIEEENPLKTQGYDALESLAAQPAVDESGDPLKDDDLNPYNSLLAYYILKDPVPPGLEADIKNFFPSDVNFKINRIRITDLKEDQDLDLDDCTDPLVTSPYWIDEKSCTATRIVEHDGSVYKVVLYLWYNT